MEYIRLEKISVEGNLINYFYSTPPEFNKYLKSLNNALFVEYPADVDLKQVPEGVLAIPFVGCMLSVSMLLNMGIEVPVLDETFFNCLPDIKKTYKKMYPYLNLSFNVVAHKITNCQYAPEDTKSLFFTGGVDATSALVEVADEHPLLINIWGGDISTQDTASHAELEHYFDKISHAMNTRYVFIKSNCREMFNEAKVTKMCALKILPWQNHGWWASIAHILSMASLVAPIAYWQKIGVHYIASSYDARRKTFDANNDAMLSAIRFGSCQLIPVDSLLERNGKAEKIIAFSAKRHVPFELKVCWYRKAGKNCSQCEKCYRTILEICANHGDPNEFGFNVTADTYRNIKEYLKHHYINKGFWTPIQMQFRKEKEFWKKDPDIAWILDCKFNRPQAVFNRAKQVVKKFV